MESYLYIKGTFTLHYTGTVTRMICWDNWSEQRKGNVNLSSPITKVKPHSPLLVIKVPLAAFILFCWDIAQFCILWGCFGNNQKTYLLAPESHNALWCLFPSKTIKAHSSADFLCRCTISVSSLTILFTVLSTGIKHQVITICICNSLTSMWPVFS